MFDHYDRFGGDFYHRQWLSKNPLQRWFHGNRYRIAERTVLKWGGVASRVLDIGCGSAEWNQSGLDVMGVDLNAQLLEYGKQSGQLSKYEVGDILEVDLPPASFDVVTAFETLEHMANYRGVIGRGAALLKPGGVMIVSVPYDTWLSWWRPLFFLQVMYRGYLKNDDYYKARCGHVNHFSPRSIQAALTDAGLHLERCFSMKRFTIFAVARKP